MNVFSLSMIYPLKSLNMFQCCTRIETLYVHLDDFHFFSLYFGDVKKWPASNEDRVRDIYLFVVVFDCPIHSFHIVDRFNRFIMLMMMMILSQYRRVTHTQYEHWSLCTHLWHLLIADEQLFICFDLFSYFILYHIFMAYFIQFSCIYLQSLYWSMFIMIITRVRICCCCWSSHSQHVWNRIFLCDHPLTISYTAGGSQFDAHKSFAKTTHSFNIQIIHTIVVVVWCTCPFESVESEIYLRISVCTS